MKKIQVEYEVEIFTLTDYLGRVVSSLGYDLSDLDVLESKRSQDFGDFFSP